MSSVEGGWRNAVLTAEATIQQAIYSLNESSCQIVLVVSLDGVFLGTLTDGDIRRGLLRGLNLNSQITDLIHHNALVVPPAMGREAVQQLMLANKIRQIPVVDERHQVVGLHVWDDLTVPPVRPNLMVIMAGGKGTRLLPHTQNCPKPLVSVAGKPMLEHIIERAKLEGFSRFVIAIHYLGEMIEQYFGDGNRLGVHIDYLREQSPLGTAGALSLLSPQPDDPFIVTNGDVITDIRYGELLDFHGRCGAAATMAVRMHEWQHPFGIVQTEGIEIVGFEEKPVMRSHINAGVYALSPEVLRELVPETDCDMPILFERLKGKSKRTVAYPMHEPWLDVGRPADLLAAQTFSE